MNIDFSEQDVLCIYLEFKNKLKDSNQLKEIQPNNKNAKQDIKLYSSITGKIEEACSQLIELGKLI